MAVREQTESASEKSSGVEGVQTTLALGLALTAGNLHPPSGGGAGPRSPGQVPAAPRGRDEQPGRPGILPTKESPKSGAGSRSKSFFLNQSFPL